MYETPRSWPLQWPSGYPRTSSLQRRSAPFRSHGKPLTIASAMARLQTEIDRLGGRLAVLSTNVETRLDGLPRSDGRMASDDPGVALYFQLKGKPTAMPCDAFSSVADNIAAIAGHIEAVRRIARYGVGTVEQMFQGFQAIRGPGPKPWREVLGIPERAAVNPAFVKERVRDLAKAHHPDINGGSTERMAEINDAADRALAELEMN